MISGSPPHLLEDAVAPSIPGETLGPKAWWLLRARARGTESRAPRGLGSEKLAAHSSDALGIRVHILFCFWNIPDA